MKQYRAAVSGVVVCAIILLASFSNAQTNSWLNPGSGYWEDSSWSLGQPPGLNQTILLTNAGWKALEIRQNTAANFPQTLIVDSIIVSSPTNTVNTLLLNFAGVDSPLVANSLTLNENSVITMHSSALLVQSNLSIGGTFNQNDFSSVTAGTMQIGDVGEGTYILSNGTLAVTNLEALGGWGHYALFDQEGGYHFATPLQINAERGEYDLNGGQLGGSVLMNGGVLLQSGGDLDVPNLSVDGSYLLRGGTAETPGGLTITNGFVTQSGGTNSTGAVLIGSLGPEFRNGSFTPEFPGQGNYTLFNGVLNASSVTIDYQGILDLQDGVININGPLNMPYYFVGPSPGQYLAGSMTVNGGTLTAASVNANGNMSQSAGTVQVAGDFTLFFYPAEYLLSGGLLSTSNTLVGPAGITFDQSGGQHIVQNLLQIQGPPGVPYGYQMSAGQLVAPYINITGSSFTHNGGSVSNSILFTLNAGTLTEKMPGAQYGRLRVTDGAGYGSTSTLSLPAGPCVIQFLGSAGQIWSNSAVLQITGWAGSFNGGGQSQIIFGNSSGGLTSAQLARIQFAFSQGTYSAKILSSGEIVPNVVGTPFYPTDLSAMAFPSNRVDLAWTDNAFNEYGYGVERSLDGTNFVQICATEENITNYSDTEVTADTHYYYRVRALNTNGNSDYSNLADVTTKANAPIAGMIAWWRGDGNAEDSVGPHNGSVPLAIDYPAGKIGQAFDFPGVGQRVVVPDSPDFVLTNAFSIEGWMYPRQQDNGIISMRGDYFPGETAWLLTMHNIPGDLSFVISDSTDSVEIDAPVQTNQWQHFAATFDATNGLCLYINGVLAAHTNTTIIPVGVLETNANASIGIGNSGVTQYANSFDGLLDEIALYSRALTPHEIEKIYNAGGTGKFALLNTTVKLAPQSGGVMQLNLDGPLGRAFEIDISTNLMNWTPWQTQLNASGTVSITDDTTTNCPARYYRIMLLP